MLVEARHELDEVAGTVAVFRRLRVRNGRIGEDSNECCLMDPGGSAVVMWASY
jgi:hypothetical protein